MPNVFLLEVLPMDDGLREEIGVIKGKQEMVIQQLGSIERKSQWRVLMVRRLIIGICLAILLPVIAFGLDLQALIDQEAAQGGGTVYLNPGVIVVTEPVILRKGVSLCGAYPAPPDPEEVDPDRHTVLRAYHSDVAVLRTEPGWQGVIKNLVIDGKWIARDGLLLHNARGGEVRNCLIMDVDEIRGVGLHLISPGDGWCTRNYFHRVNVYYGRIGVWLESLNGNPVTLNMFDNCHLVAHYISVRFTDYADTNFFRYCRIGAITYGVAFEDGVDIYNNIFMFPIISAIEPDAWGIICKPSDTTHDAPNKFIEPYFGYLFPSRWENYLKGKGNCEIISLE